MLGTRHKTLEDLKECLQKYLGKKVVNIFESESERLENLDYMIDYELENDNNVYTIYYLKDNENNYYITEI